MFFQQCVSSIVWTCWKFLAVVTFILALPSLPWVCWLFYHNIRRGCRVGNTDIFMLDWGIEPETRLQWLFHSFGHHFRPFFELCMECICKDD